MEHQVSKNPSRWVLPVLIGLITAHLWHAWVLDRHVEAINKIRIELHKVQQNLKK